MVSSYLQSSSIVQVEIIHHVPTWDHKAVQRRHRMPVVNGDRKRVRGDDALLVQFTEYAALLSKRMAFTDGPEIRVIARALVGAAQPAEGLQVVRIIGPAVFARNDVVDIECPLIRCQLLRLTAHLDGSLNQFDTIKDNRATPFSGRRTEALHEFGFSSFVRRIGRLTVQMCAVL